MTTTDQTVEEMSGSLNGFDEIAIAKTFGAEWTDLAEHKPIRMLRALVFVDRRRTGDNDADAYQHSMDLTVDVLNEYFAEDDEVTPDDPETEPGKGDSPPA